MTERLDPVPCEELLHRLLRNKTHVDAGSGKALPAAFHRRPTESGLSVDLKSLRTVEESCSSLRKVFGVVSLHTGSVRDVSTVQGTTGERINLEVVHDPVDHTDKPNPAHTLICKVPLREENLAGAEHVARMLSLQARKVAMPRE